MEMRGINIGSMECCGLTNLTNKGSLLLLNDEDGLKEPRV